MALGSDLTRRAPVIFQESLGRYGAGFVTIECGVAGGTKSRLLPMMLRRIFQGMFAFGIVSIVVFSLSPYPAVYLSFYLSDKIEHAVAYAIVALFGALGFARPRQQAAVVVILVGLGGVLELLQLLVPGRMCDPADALANAAGVLTGLLAARVLSLALPVVIVAGD